MVSKPVFALRILLFEEFLNLEQVLQDCGVLALSGRVTIADTSLLAFLGPSLSRRFSQEVIERLEPRKSYLLLRNLFPARCAQFSICMRKPI
jgi:hypothetical protein